MNSNKLWQSSIERTDKGTFAQKEFGDKKIRSMKLSDYAWDKLQAMAEENNCSRTDVIEEFTRANNNEQEIVIKALESFIKSKEADWGSNPSQRGEFNPKSRTWDVFNQFRKLVGQLPWEVGIGEKE